MKLQQWTFLIVGLFLILLKTSVNGDWRLLVIGGETAVIRYGSKYILEDVELLDPFNKYSNCTKPPPIPFPRKCMVVENWNGQPFVIGGGSAGMKFDTSLALINNTWVDTPYRLHHERYCATSALPNRRTIWVLGGDIRGTATGMTSEVLQATGGFPKYHISRDHQDITKRNIIFNDSVVAPPDTRFSENDRKCLARINDTHMFLVGYNNNASYIVSTLDETYKFTRLPNMRFGSHIGGACVTINDSLGVNRLFVLGGGNAQRNSFNLMFMSKTEFYDFSTNQWIEGPDLPRTFYMGGFVMYPDDRGLVLIGGQNMTNYGGRYKPKYYSDVIRYNKTLNGFEYLSGNLNYARSRFGAMLVETIDDNCTIISPMVAGAVTILPEHLMHICTIIFIRCLNNLILQ